jgi:hypothetical protein
VRIVLPPDTVARLAEQAERRAARRAVPPMLRALRVPRLAEQPRNALRRR